VSRHDVTNAATFDTPDWNVVGNLPSGAAGNFAAFAADLVTGDCMADDETGAIVLDSPSIVVPANSPVPRVAFDHWVATEAGFDGGNVKISVNSGVWTLIPASAFTFNAYNTQLNAPPTNTNPLATQPAFTGIDTGSNKDVNWGQSQVDLTGFAQAGDSIRLRFDFGVDGCNGLTGWYIDSVEVYACIITNEIFSDQFEQ
jgi:hypothetical protein